jgi:peptidoglycan/xylan/chitin deacetylase (PgdA/CDA1 family)
MTVVTACGHPSPQTRWQHGLNRDDSSPSAAASSPDPTTPSPATQSASPSAKASKKAPSGPPPVAAPAGDFLARLPKFGPPPPATPITVPDGPTAPIYKRLPISQAVAFLTIDDGWTQLPEGIRLMRAAHIPFSMFLIAPVAARSPDFFRQLVDAGGVVEDHTITHPDLKGKPYDFQRHEICDAKSSLEHTFGTSLHLFRPPFGNYDQTTLKAVRDCGLKAAFYWSETVNNGTVFYQTAEHQIHAGDIILMHFRPAFVNDVIAALTAIHNAGLTPALLENYIA